MNASSEHQSKSGHTQKRIPTLGKEQRICRYGRIVIIFCDHTRLLAENLQLQGWEGEQRVDTLHLGASEKQTFFKVIVPGALPFIFTGLQISMGYAWFSLVAGEMLAGEFGLGYLIWNSYTLVQYPVIIIAMITLGVIGSLSSLLIRLVGDKLMQWKVREVAQ